MLSELVVELADQVAIDFYRYHSLGQGQQPAGERPGARANFEHAVLASDGGGLQHGMEHLFVGEPVLAKTLAGRLGKHRVFTKALTTLL